MAYMGGRERDQEGSGAEREAEASGPRAQAQWGKGGARMQMTEV